MPGIKKHITIPVFIPMAGCPHECVFCNQRYITGKFVLPTVQEVHRRMQDYLQTIKSSETTVEAAYFGGSFTALPLAQQEAYLSILQPFLASGQINGIRLSTRPDYINRHILQMLRHYGVRTIELGIQSFDNQVLQLSGRGHTADDNVSASTMVRDMGFRLGMQMMLGLPGDTLGKSLFTAKNIIESGADETRIYPALVLRHTRLEVLWGQGRYVPLSLHEAIFWAGEVVKTFEQSEVRILRLGLHPSQDLIDGNYLLAGPFHVAFGLLVHSALWGRVLASIPGNRDASLQLEVNAREVNAAAGYRGENKKCLMTRFRKVEFRSNYQLTGRNYIAHYN